MPKRCALGCSNKNTYHRFPHPEKNPDHFKAWVHIAGGKLDSPADYELYRKKVICDIHFTDDDRNRNNRLNFLAVPSLHLPGKSDEVGSLEKVLLVPEPVNEESNFATLKRILTGKSDEVGTSEKVLLVPEPVNEESSLAILKLTPTDNSASISSEHNYFLHQKKAIHKNSITLSEAMKIGFIGGGKLAFALANGFITAGLAKADEITASCHPSDVASAKAFKGIGATAVFKNKSVVERSEVVIVSVKPDVVVSALREVKDLPASKNKLFISVAMGISTATVEKNLPSEARVIRVMPNTPALVKEGAAALSRGSRATDEDAKLTTELFSAVGTCDEVPEYQMDAITALSGSGPAYVYMLIESLADGGVRCGLPRDLALRLAAQTTLGAAAMLRNGDHPAALKDNVTSPGGSTAEGTYHLEKNGFRSAIIGAVTAARDRCKVVNQQLNN